MATATELVRDFVLQLEKTIGARRLYRRSNAAFRDANDRLVEKCRLAAAAEPFTLTFGATDIFYGKVSLLHKEKLEESFFFPLYRDGMRELTFATNVSAEDIDKFLALLEAKDQYATDDLVSSFWRAELATITHKAIDGIGDTELDAPESEGSELHALVTDLADKIRDPAAPMTGQKYAFMLDADVQVAAQDFHYDALSMHRSFDENPSVLRLSDEQAAQIRAELGEDRDQALVERFIEILLLIARSPADAVSAATVVPVFQQIAEGYWNARDYGRVAAILSHVHLVSTDAPKPEFRSRLAEVVRHFVTPERLTMLLLDLIGGAVTPQIASRFWDFADPEVVWPILLDASSRLPEGASRAVVLQALRRRMATNIDLFRRTLASTDLAQVRAALALLDERIERLFANDLVFLTSHEDEQIRLRGLATAARVGGPLALEALWRAMECDPSKAARLYAFRAISAARWPELAPRLIDLVNDGNFMERPAWERDKYVQLLGEIAGDQAAPLFESWIPEKKWLWQAKDLEILELALRGLAATGPEGRRKVHAIADAGGKPGNVAREVLMGHGHPESRANPQPEAAM